MAVMIACKKYFDKLKLNTQRGASVLEVILSITVVFAITPFLYYQITNISNDVQDIAMANRIVKLRDGVTNFVRVHQSQWPDVVEIQLTDEEVKQISPMAHGGFIDKYKIKGAVITDVYLAFNINDSAYRAANVVKYIGDDAAIVREDGIAYSQIWAVSAPNIFMPGDVIFRISRDFDSEDKTRFLHRGTMGEDNLNQMQRNLHMNNFDLFNVADVKSLSAKISDVDAVFLNADVVDADTVYFSSGANMNTNNITIGSMRVTGDTSGFRKIVADKLNGNKYVTSGKLIVDSATVGNSVNVAGNLILKANSAQTITGFNGISASKLLTPYLFATEMVFRDNFGITVSGELLLSGQTPLQIGAWGFPTNIPPSFSRFILTRASIPSVPDIHEFKNITSKNWHTK